MKHFKCGKCQAIYKIDENKITTTQVMVKCPKCGAQNVLRFGPILVIQTKDKISQIPLKEGLNTLGRNSKSNNVDIPVDDQYVSRQHLAIEIEQNEGKLYISLKDVGSTNGTFNKQKQKLKKGVKYPFQPNDYYTIGLTKLIFKFN
jgi:predicted Zn finger-like uncharacterized protein